jgi:fatty-acyl-CoA synthase
MNCNNPIFNSLYHCASKNPDGPAFIHGTTPISWRELWRSVARVAAYLQSVGVVKGDRIAFLLANSPDFIICNAACHVIGAIVVPLGTRLRPTEIEAHLQEVTASVLIFDTRFDAAVGQIETAGMKLISSTASTLSCSGVLNEICNSSLYDHPRIVEMTSADVGVLLFTSGTTGKPKAVALQIGSFTRMLARMILGFLIQANKAPIDDVRLSHLQRVTPLPVMGMLVKIVRSKLFGYLINAVPAAVWIFLIEQVLRSPALLACGYRYPLKVMLPSMPFYHAAGYQILSMMNVLGCLCLVLDTELHLDPDRILQLSAQHRVIAMANVPYGWRKIIAAAEKGDCHRGALGWLFSGASNCDKGTKKRILEFFKGALFLDILGMTELATCAAIKIDGSSHSLARNSAGDFVIKVKIMDGAGSELATGEVGEICYDATAVMSSSFSAGDCLTHASIRDGWLHSGDLGYISESGELFVVDRIDSIINSGGEKISPQEVEQALREHADIEDACVYGIPDPDWGQKVCAMVKTIENKTLTAQELKVFLGSRLAGFKLPKQISFVGELPVQPTGKTKRCDINLPVAVPFVPKVKKAY